MPNLWSRFLDFFRKDPSKKQFSRAKALYAKYEASNGEDTKALNESIANFELALNNRRKGKDGLPHPDLGITLTTYASALWRRYEDTKSDADLLRVIELDEEAFKLWDATDPASRPLDYANLLLDLGNAYQSQYNRNTSLSEMLMKAIQKYEKLAEEADVAKQRKGLVKLGIALMAWYEDDKISKTDAEKTTRLDEAIASLDQALGPESIDEGSKNLDATQRQALLNLAMVYYLRYQAHKQRGDLEAAIDYNRKALTALSGGDGDYVYCSFDLAQQLFAKYECEQGRRNTSESQPGAWLDIDLKADKGSEELHEAKRALEDALEEMERMDGLEGLKSDMQRLLATVKEHIKGLSKTASRKSSASNLPAQTETSHSR